MVPGCVFSGDTDAARAGVLHRWEVKGGPDATVDAAYHGRRGWSGCRAGGGGSRIGAAGKVSDAYHTVADIAAVSNADVWVVGEDNNDYDNAYPLIGHWNGTSWKIQPRHSAGWRGWASPLSRPHRRPTSGQSASISSSAIPAERPPACKRHRTPAAGTPGRTREARPHHLTQPPTASFAPVSRASSRTQRLNTSSGPLRSWRARGSRTSSAANVASAGTSSRWLRRCRPDASRCCRRTTARS